MEKLVSGFHVLSFSFLHGTISRLPTNRSARWHHFQPESGFKRSTVENSLAHVLVHILCYLWLTDDEVSIEIPEEIEGTV